VSSGIKLFISILAPLLILWLDQQLYTAQEHPDPDLLEHVKQLTAELEANGIQPSAPDVEEGDVAEGEEDWEDTDDEKEDVEMK
jgi:hypothetical protein